MNTKTIIFDFDGTIANTLDKVVEIYNRYLAPEFNSTPISSNDLEKIRNSRFQDVYKSYNIPWIKLPLIVLRGRQLFKNEIPNIKPIDGIQLALKQLRAYGHSLGILTSNSSQNVRDFLVKYNLEGIFDFVDSEKNLFGKHNSLSKLLKRHQLKKEQVIYVGDETRDIEATHKVGITMIAVTWGFNKKEILKGLNPDFIIDEPKQLPELLTP